jgi:hypothetical protein
VEYHDRSLQEAVVFSYTYQGMQKVAIGGRAPKEQNSQLREFFSPLSRRFLSIVPTGLTTHSLPLRRSTKR